MKPSNRIVTAFDPSPSGHQALDRTAALAAALQCELQLVHHVRQPLADSIPLVKWARDAARQREARRAEAARMLERVATRVAELHQVTVSTSIIEGDAFEQLRDMARGATLVVYAVQGRNALRARVFGAALERLVRMGTSPTLLALGNCDGPYRNALVPLDFSRYSQPALRLAQHVAPDAAFEYLHVLPPERERRLRRAGTSDERIEAYRARAKARAHARLSAYVSAKGAEGVLRIEHTDPVWTCRDRARHFDLVVLGQDGDSSLGRFLLGDVTQALLSQLPCDTLVLPKAWLGHARMNWPTSPAPLMLDSKWGTT
jgi:CPA2 family monovalent cation:H+ antiporter-2